MLTDDFNINFEGKDSINTQRPSDVIKSFNLIMHGEHAFHNVYQPLLIIFGQHEQR